MIDPLQELFERDPVTYRASILRVAEAMLGSFDSDGETPFEVAESARNQPVVEFYENLAPLFAQLYEPRSH